MPELGSPAPVSAIEFKALLSSCHALHSDHALPPNLVAIAVSGGADSMALALRTAEWAGSQRSALIALIVDHRLRPESDAEAKEVQSRLKNVGINAEILVWHHGNITSALHAVARSARYDLMERACAKHQRKFLLLGHHLDDQAETILLRLAKGTGIDGLGGMEQSSIHNGLSRLRPFLTVPKSRLVATCNEFHCPYVEDSSNHSLRYARGRLRKIMPYLEQEGFSPSRLSALGQRAQFAREALDFYAAQLLRTTAEQDSSGALNINMAPWFGHPWETQYRALNLCLETLAHQQHPPRHQALSHLLQTLQTPESLIHKTLHGVTLRKMGMMLECIREVAAIPRNVPLAQSGQIWDHRWQLMLPPDFDCEDIVINPLGTLPHEMIDRLSPELRKKIPQGRKRASLPSLWKGGSLIYLPSLSLHEGFWIAPHNTIRTET